MTVRMFVKPDKSIVHVLMYISRATVLNVYYIRNILGLFSMTISLITMTFKGKLEGYMREAIVWLEHLIFAVIK